MATKIQFRRGTAAQWTSANPLLAQGEIGIELDTQQYKFGDGLNNWNDLPYGGLAGPEGPAGPAGTDGVDGVDGAGVPIGGTAGQILAKIDGVDYNTEWIDNYTSQVKHEVKAAVAITKGKAVYVSSATGTNMIVSPASNNSEIASSKTMGLLAQDLAVNGIGFLITEGLLSGINTDGAVAGDPVWLGTNGALIFGIANKPQAPAHMVYLGVVTRVHANNGEIFVKVQNGYELDELHNVSTSTATVNNFLKLNSSGLWVGSNEIDGGTA